MINLFLKHNLSPTLRILIILTNDILLLNLSLYLSYYLRIEYFLKILSIINVLIISTLIYLILFFIFKIYKQYFRYFNNNSYQLYFKLYVAYGILFGFYVLLQNEYFIPRSLVLIFPSFFFFLIIVNRIIVAKFFQYESFYNQKKAIIFGFNPANINALLSYAKVTCFVDDKKNTKKRIVNDIKIISTNSFIQNYQKLKFDLILIDNEKVFIKLRDIIRNHIIDREIIVQKISFKNNEIITGSYFDFNYFFNRKNKITPLGDTYKNKIILITGAGGSIGSNIVFQLLQCKYHKLILIDNSEYNLFKLSSKINNKKNISFHLINFNNKNDLKRILSEDKVDIIFHAAAFKHVPLIELNPFSAIKNNFLDTFDFMKFITNFNVKNFCLVSSDKAVRPTNIMGASKRLSELALCYLDKLSNHNTSFCSVRFGNVINSSGSVKPTFQNQIDNFLPVTLTHKKIVRYFMTIEEAANLVLNTTKISKGGEIFLLDMGEPIKLYDLAKLMIQFSGKTVKKNGYGDIEIKIIGLRDGEKLYEELLIDEQSTQSSINFIYQSLESKISNKNFQEIYTNIHNSYKSNNIKSLKKALKGKFINYVSSK